MKFYDPKPKTLAEALTEAKARNHPAERYRLRDEPAPRAKGADD